MGNLLTCTNGVDMQEERKLVTIGRPKMSLNPAKTQYDRRISEMDQKDKSHFKEGDKFGYLCDDGAVVEAQVIMIHSLFPQRIFVSVDTSIRYTWIDLACVQICMHLIKLPGFPSKYLTNPVFINNHEFVVAPTTDGIYKFNIRQNEWKKVLDYDSNLECYAPRYGNKLFYDSQTQILYFWKSKDDELLQFDLKIGKLTSSSCLQHQPGLIYVEGELHQICTYTTKDHLIWDKQVKKLISFHIPRAFESFRMLRYHGLIYLNSMKCILLFGGERICRNTCSLTDKIYEYSTTERKWRKLNILMPTQKAGFGMVATRNERYVIMFGGWKRDFCYYTDEILIYDTKNKTFHESKAKCPAKALFHATISNDTDRDSMIISGYVHSFDLKKFPICIIEFMAHFVCNQEIYLLQYDGGSHWKINVDDILKDCARINQKNKLEIDSDWDSYLKSEEEQKEF
eukprot:411374_1